MPGRHIILQIRDDDIIHKNNSNKKNKCIGKKMDFLSCVKSNPQYTNCITGSLNSNKYCNEHD